MSFLYPLGLLGLLAIPVLIIIYIIKNKYTEQIITSTYLWTLSEKFLKRKNPINRITGIISLILQILAVILISFACAHPVFVLPAAANDFCFVLDGSGSMNITREGKTRFDYGKDEISSLIKESADGSTYTLIYTGETTEVVYENIEDKNRALSLLSEMQPSFSASGFADAMTAAQEYFTENSAIKTYLVTDKSYETVENVTLLNVSASESNYALSGVECALSGGNLTVNGNAVSYTDDADVTVELYLNEDTEPVASETLSLTGGEVAAFSLDGGDNADYRLLRVAIKESDALALDNEVVVYNVRYDNSYSTLLVSETPFFIEKALQAAGNSQIDFVKPENYTESETGGYGLYIFDSFSPKIMPRDGAVWFVNPVASTEKSGFSVQGIVKPEVPGAVMVKNNSSSTKVKSLLKGTVDDDVYLKEYVKCGLYRSFTTAFSHEGNPLVFAGTNSYGNREAVFAFALKDAEFAVSVNFGIMVYNMLNYTFPEIVDGSTYYCGDTVLINVLTNCDSVRIESERGTVEYLDSELDIIEYELKEEGIYTVTLMVSGSPRVINIFSQLPEAERATAVTEASFVIHGEPSDAKRDGVYRDLLIMFIVLAVIFIADWMVYCYEQYQLR